jgi:hypothetical protein
MENKKYEQLIDLIINEQEDKARELFHEIVVEKSREIYESIMDEEMMGEEADDMVGEVGQLMSEIDVEESGVVEDEEDDADIKFDDEAEEDGEEVTHDLEAGHDEEPKTVDEVKDKFEELLADFERILNGDDEGSEEEVVAGDEEVSDEAMMEAVQLQKVPGLYDSKIGGDDGAQTKSPALNKPKVEAAGVKPVNFSAGGDLKQSNGPVKASNYGTKGEGDLIGDVANTPGMKKAPALKAAPKPVTSQASGVNTKSPVSKG